MLLSSQKIKKKLENAGLDNTLSPLQFQLYVPSFYLREIQETSALTKHELTRAFSSAGYQMICWEGGVQLDERKLRVSPQVSLVNFSLSWTKKSHSLKLYDTKEQINPNYDTDLPEKICANQEGNSDISYICNNS